MRPQLIRPLTGTRATPPPPLASAPRLTAVLSLLAVLAIGCSSSKKAATTATTAPAATGAAVTSSSTTAQAPTTASTTAPTAAPTTASSAGGLSGTWSGQYSGSFQGTFTLTWQQSGSTLRGNIKLTTPPATLSVNGTLQGSAIRFGTVGSVGITYSGSVSGSSMSGTYQTGGGGGPWSATKSS